MHNRLIEAGRAKDLRRIEWLAEKNQEASKLQRSRTPTAQQTGENFNPENQYIKSKVFIQEKEKRLLQL